MAFLVCDHCGKPFERKYADIKKRAKRGTTHHFCSRVCVYASPLRKAAIGVSRVQQHSDIRQMAEWEAAYIAGIIDGEGTITLYQVGANGRFQYNCVVSVANTDTRLLDFCLAKTGIGFVREASGNATRPAHHSAQYIWYVSKRADIIGLLDAIDPYLLGKREESNAMREFCRRRIAGTPIDATDEALCRATKRRPAR